MKKSTRRRRARKEHEKRWVEVVALAEAGVPKAEIARRVGVSRQTVYNVLRKATGLPGGTAPVPKPPGPLPGTRIKVTREAAELAVRWRREHPTHGYNYCYHDLKRQGFNPPAPATIGRIWRRAGLMVSRACGSDDERRKTRWVPPRPQEPGHVQVDIKYLPGKKYELTVIDVYSRYVDAVIVESLSALTAKTAFEAVLKRLPFIVHTIQTDNGGEFEAEFKTFIEGKNLARRTNASYSPWQNGVVERFHRTVAEECYLGFPGDLETASTAELQSHLASYLLWYNGERLHSALDYRTPLQALAVSQNRRYPSPVSRVSNYPLS